MHSFAVDRDLDLMRVARGAGNVHLECVFGLDREVRANREPAAGAEGEFVESFLLQLFRVKAIDIHHHGHLGIAGCEAADFSGRVEVALHRGGRNEQQVRDVVEAARGVVGGQEQRVVDLFRQRVDR